MDCPSHQRPDLPYETYFAASRERSPNRFNCICSASQDNCRKMSVKISFIFWLKLQVFLVKLQLSSFDSNFFQGWILKLLFSES